MPRSASARSSRAAPRADETNAEAVARYVRKLIFEGRLSPGQRLPQDEIGHAVGVSRIPVREAIISLEREGWLRVENHRGAYILPLDEAAITDRFALYGRFYGFAARRAIERMTPSDLEQLDALAGAVEKARTPAAMEGSTTAYFAHLVNVAASNRLRAVLRSCSAIVPGNFFASVDGTLATQKHGIAALQAAIAAGDPGAAERASVDLQAVHAEAVVTLLAGRAEARTAKADSA
jgi:DNA-binding GntR family transcriptional regulator